MNAFTPVVELAKIDDKLTFLARAAARFELVEAGEMTIDEAFDGLIVSLRCRCSREIFEHWNGNHQRPIKPAQQFTHDATENWIGSIVDRLASMHLGDPCHEQLNKLVRLLASNKDGEVIAVAIECTGANAGDQFFISSLSCSRQRLK
jgi:hypothetical protein